MTAKPQQMSDGQEKSDDLIAELAKLMATNAQGPEPEPKPAPKLVTLNDSPRPAAPAAAPPTFRIPGMDNPVRQPAEAAAAAPKPAFTGIRIPGMDAPVPAPAAPSSPLPQAAAPKPADPKPADPAPTRPLGFSPAPAAPKVEPTANWQERETPKPAPIRPQPVITPPPAPKAEPVLVTPPPAPAPKPVPTPVVAETRQPQAAAPSPKPQPARQEPSFAAVPKDDPLPSVAQALAESPVSIPGANTPADDHFDFNFDFSDTPDPAPKSAKPDAAPKAAETDDPIADLIAAELDAVDVEAQAEPVVELPKQTPPPLPPRPAPQQPAARTFTPPGPAALTPRPAPNAMPRPNPPAPNVAAPAPRPVAAGRPEADGDRFQATPVMAPAPKPVVTPPPAAANAAPVVGDPMDEIESLIGEAVRVELSGGERPATPPVQQIPPQPAAPVVPPLTTGFAPRRAVLKKGAEPQVSPGEEAILAAAAATGASVGRMDAMDSPYKRPRAKPERRETFGGGMRQYIGMAVAGTLLLAAGFGLYWVLGMGRGGSDADAPVLTADATPVKAPAPVVAGSENTQGSVVFKEMDGVGADPNERLVSRDDSSETSVADVARTVGADNGSDSELANRKVRTVTVRPDGTIVSGDEAVAGNAALPVDRPNVPTLPGADVQPSDLLAAIPSNPGSDAISAAIGNSTPAANSGTALALAQPSDPANVDPSIVPPVPMARPANRSALAGGTARPAAGSTANAPVQLLPNNAPAAPAQTVATNTSGAYVQLSSQRSESEAQASLRTTQNRLSGVLGGSQLAIRRVDLGARGVWYRVVLPTSSFQSATQTCANIKANGGDCVAING